MTKTILGISWASWEMIYVFPLLILFFAIVWWQFKKRKRAIQFLATKSQQVSLLKHFSPIKQVLKIILFIVGLLFLFIALLQPQWHEKEKIIEQEGRDVCIALDISRSMLAQDCKPDRLSFAKKKIRTLVKMLDCERVGLILFSGSTVIQCPLTADYSAFFMFLDHIDQQTISSGTTAIEKAIAKTLKMYQTMPSKKNKLLVIFTDGEDFSSNLHTMKKKAHEAGLHMFAIGVGTKEGAPIPIVNEDGVQVGHQKDEKGNIVISRLNEGILHSVAHESGGKYISLTQDETDLKMLIKQVQQYEKEKFEDKKVSSLENQYPYFIAVSLCCFLLEWLL